MNLLCSFRVALLQLAFLAFFLAVFPNVAEGGCSLRFDCPQIGQTWVHFRDDWLCRPSSFCEEKTLENMDDECWELWLDYSPFEQKDVIAVQGGFKTHLKCGDQPLPPAQRWFSFILKPFKNVKVYTGERMIKDYFAHKRDDGCEAAEPGISELWATCQVVDNVNELSEEKLKQFYPWIAEQGNTRQEGLPDRQEPQGLNPGSPEYKRVANDLTVACAGPDSDIGPTWEFIEDNAPQLGVPCVNRHLLAALVGEEFREVIFKYRAKSCAMGLELAKRASATDLVQEYVGVLNDYLQRAKFSDSNEALQWATYGDFPRMDCGGNVLR